MMEHLSRWSDWELGINPFGTSKPPLTQPNWVQSPQFELLLLTTVASANRLPTAQLLSLAGHLRHVWSFFDPVVYASVLRLLTSQVSLNDAHVCTTGFNVVACAARNLGKPYHPYKTLFIPTASELGYCFCNL